MTPTLLIILAVVTVQTPTSTAFSSSPSTFTQRLSKQQAWITPTARFADAGDAESETPEETSEESDAPVPVPAPGPEPPKPRRLDPLVASLTRVDDDAKNVKTIKTPLLEVPMDGSLVVLIPTALIAVVGFAMSIVVGLNSQDAIVGALNDLSDEVKNAAVQRTNVVPDDGSCRGICGPQEGDFVGRAFMESLSKSKE